MVEVMFSSFPLGIRRRLPGAGVGPGPHWIPGHRRGSCNPPTVSSEPPRITVKVTSAVPIADPLTTPIAAAEFLAVDTETNGLSGDACEMTEVGAVLVGGGELHDRWSTLCRTSAPLQRGIQRFTGITQAMVDSAPSLEDVFPSLAQRLSGRILVAH